MDGSLSIQPPSTTELTSMVSADEARHRVISGGFLLCLGVPVGAQVGLGLRLHTVGPKFLGYKGLPVSSASGLPLLVQTSSPAASVGAGVRVGATGFFLPDASDTDIFVDGVAVALWDADTETLGLAQPGWEGRAEWTMRARTMQLDTGLAMWTADEEVEWRSLVSCVSTDVLASCGIELGAAIEPSGDGRMEVLADGLETAAHVTLRTLRTPKFSSIKRTRTPRAGATPAEITTFNVDASQQLEALLSARQGRSPEWLLGELQVAFVLFLLLSSLPGLEQWKALVDILCRCDVALIRRPRLFQDFLQVLDMQLNHAPTDFFTDELSQDNFLRHSLTQISQLIEEGEGDQNVMLRRQMTDFRARIETQFGWVIPTRGNSFALFDDLEEDGPVYVPLVDCHGLVATDVEDVHITKDGAPKDNEEGRAGGEFAERKRQMESALDAMNVNLPGPARLTET